MSTLQFDPNQLGYNADVVVIGAGISGLVATWRLIREGVDAVLLEARDRVGGRANSGTFNGESYDLGARWISPHAKQFRQLAHELGIQLTPQYSQGESAIRLNGRSVRFRNRAPWFAPNVQLDYRRIIAKLNHLSRQLQLQTVKSALAIKNYDQFSFGAWLHQQSSAPATQSLFRLLTHVHFMAEPSEISFVYVLDQIQAYQRAEIIFSLRPAHEQDRISGGMQRITERLAQQLRPQLNVDTPVLAMRQDEESVSAYSRGASFRARYAIIAAPPAVAAQIYYEPALPSNRDALNQRVVMGRAIQAVLCYDYPFWRENKKSGFLMSDDGPASIIHDVSPTTSSEGALACVIIGDNASHWSEQPRSERLRALVTQLTSWFGNEALAYRGMIERDWNNERWSRGTVGFMPPGSAGFVHAIGTPVGRIHWASSETATQWSGSIEGAIEAGERTAAEVIGQLSSAGLLRQNT